MAGDNAELGFSVDTSQVETATTRLNELAKSAQGVTSSIDKMAQSFSAQTMPDGMRRGFMGNITRDFNSLQNTITQDIINSGETAGKGWWSKFVSGIKENHNAQRELGVMSHEIISGRWANLRGSASIFLGAAGMGGLAGTGVIMGLTAAVEGIEALTESIQEAAQAQKDLQQSAILSGNAGALFSGKIDEIVNGLETVKDASKELKEEFVSNALNSGLSADFIKQHGSILLQYQQEFGDKQTEALEKILAETQTDATKGYAALYKMGDGLLDKVNKDIQSGNYKAAGADMISQLLQGAQNQAREAQKEQHELDGESWWQKSLDFMALGQIGAGGGDTLDYQHRIDVHVNKIKSANEQAKDAIKASMDSIKSPDLSHTKAYHDFTAFLHPSFRTHSGKTEAEKSAERAARALSQLKNSIYGIDEQSQSIINSINKRWDAKNQPFSNLTKDAYDFQQAQDQINQQFDKMIDRVNELRRRQGKDANNSAFDSEIAKITQQRNAALKASESGFEDYEKNLHSAIAGMKAGWKEYDERFDNVAAQQEKIWSKSLDLMTDDLTDFLTTGTLDFEKFFKDIAVMEEKYMVGNWLVKPFNDYVGGLMGFGLGGGASGAPVAATNTFAVPDIPKLGASRLGGGLGSTAPVINITINDNGNKGGVTGTNNATTGDLQKMGASLQKWLTDYIKRENVNSNRQGGVNKSMGNWSTR